MCFNVNTIYVNAKSNLKYSNDLTFILDNAQTGTNCEPDDNGIYHCKIIKDGVDSGDSDKKSVQCDSGGPNSLKSLIHKYWSWIIILAPIALIILIAVDMLKAIVSSDAEQLNKSGKAAIRRTIAVVILLFLPSLLELVLGWFHLELCF